jgi:uncharacterized protein YbjT (DUF2867 family)
MYVILGATGHVGGAAAAALLRAGEAVTVVTRDDGKAAAWRARGAEAAVVDVSDIEALRAVFRRGRRAFLLNPPAAPDTDTDAEEHRTLDAIVAALDGSGLEAVVLESTYGAQAGDAVGDLSVLYDFEQALRRQPIPATVLRAAYYMSNWDAMLEPAQGGVLPTMFPADFALPMVAPADLGEAAARLLRAPDGVVHHVEGPARYSSDDVAAAFARVLGCDVRVEATPPQGVEAAFRGLGFSETGAAAYARMIAATVDGAADMPEPTERGPTTLEAYVEGLVQGAIAPA